MKLFSCCNGAYSVDLDVQADDDALPQTVVSHHWVVKLRNLEVDCLLYCSTYFLYCAFEF